MQHNGRCPFAWIPLAPYARCAVRLTYSNVWSPHHPRRPGSSSWRRFGSTPPRPAATRTRAHSVAGSRRTRPCRSSRTRGRRSAPSTGTRLGSVGYSWTPSRAAEPGCGGANPVPSQWDSRHQFHFSQGNPGPGSGESLRVESSGGRDAHGVRFYSRPISTTGRRRTSAFAQLVRCLRIERNAAVELGDIIVIVGGEVGGV